VHSEDDWEEGGVSISFDTTFVVLTVVASRPRQNPMKKTDVTGGATLEASSLVWAGLAGVVARLARRVRFSFFLSPSFLPKFR